MMKPLTASVRKSGSSPKHSSGEWVSFIDADDLPHPKRNEVLEESILALEPGAEAVFLHSFDRVARDEEIDLSALTTYFTPFDDGAQRIHSQLTPARSRAIREVVKAPGFGKTFHTLEFLGAERVPLHHAHTTFPATVFRRRRFPLRGIRRDEDVVLLNTLFSEGVTLSLIEASLVLYREGWKNDPGFDSVEFLVPFKRRLAISRATRKAFKGLKRVRRRLVRILTGVFRLGR